jgi:hypothetical protein
MAYTSAEYHAIAQGIRDIYIQELTAPGAKPREPDEGGWIEWFHHWREEGHDLDWIRAEIRKSDEWHTVHDRPLEPPVIALPRLVPTGGVFRLETGARWTAIECSDFNLFGRYLIEGADAIRPVLKERADIGFNLLRVWSEYQGNAQFTADIGRLVPSEHPTYYDELAPFFARCASYGLYVELTVFTGTGIPGHWENIGNTVIRKGVTNVLLELANEVNAHPSIDPTAYQPIPGVLCSHGSNGAQSIPVRPPWHYETAHWNDTNEWWRKVGHNAWEFTEGADQLPASHVPTLSNETTRPDHDGTLHHFYDAAAGAALLCAGSCFHSQSGKKSALFSDFDRPFAEAWVAGARSVNLEFQEGRYVHAMELEGPTDLRVYQKILPDGRRETVRIRK